MSALARAILALYPVAYRRRYGAEMAALLEESGVGAAALLDLLKGAVVAHLRPLPGLAAALPAGVRVRTAAAGVLGCWALFVLAGLGFYKTTEDPPFSRAGDSHGALGGSHLAVQIVAVAAAVAAACALAPLLLAYWRARRDPAPATLFATEPGRRGLRTMALAGAALSLAMAAMALATAIYLVALLGDAGGLAAEANGPSGLISVGASVAIQLAAMLLATALAALAARRAVRGAGQLPPAAA